MRADLLQGESTRVIKESYWDKEELMTIKEHVRGEYYSQAAPLGFLHYSIQELITAKMLLKKGLTLEQAIREFPPYCQEEIRSILQRGYK